MSSPSAVSVEELRRAWRAVQDGQFRGRGGPGIQDPFAAPAGPVAWSPTEPVLPVLGCAGSVGATVLSLAVATVAGTARVVECCPASASGLAAASTAELGPTGTGWARGRRDGVLLDRLTDDVTVVQQVPVPDPPGAGVDLTVLDVGWDLPQALVAASWLADRLRQARVVVAVAPRSVPGLRRLECVLAALTPVRVIAAVVGPHRSRWARPVTPDLGPLGRAVAERGDLVDVRRDPALAVRGPDSAPLPPALLAAAARVLTLAGPTPASSQALS